MSSWFISSTAYRQRLVCLFLWSSLLSQAAADSDKLPKSAEMLLLKRLYARSVVEIEDLKQRNIGEFEYLGFSGSLAVSSGFEGVYHPRLIVLRKKKGDVDWSKAELFYFSDAISNGFQLQDQDFQKSLITWPPK